MHSLRTLSLGRRPAAGILALTVCASGALAAPELVGLLDDAREAQHRPLVLRGAADCGAVTLTQSTNPDVIGNGSAACVDGAASAETSAARVFVAPTTMTLKCVTFGVRFNQGGDWPVEVNILTTDNVLGPYRNHNKIMEHVVQYIMSSANREFYTVELPDVTVPAGTQFIVELTSPSRRPADGGDGGQLAFGFNGQGQSAPTYFRGPFCGAEDFVDISSLGFPNLHLVMSVGYEEGASSLLLDGFHHNILGDALFTSDGSNELVVEGDPMSGPFGFSVPFGDTTMGVQTPSAEWEAAPGTAMTVNFNLASGETDTLSFVTAPDESLTLETGFTSSVEPVFDVLVFDDGEFVGELPDQTSGSVSVTPIERFSLFGFSISCNRHKVEFADGTTITDSSYGASFRGNALFATVGAGIIGDSVELRLRDVAGATPSPPLSVDFLADGMISFKRPRHGAFAPGVRFGDASTSPRVVDGNFTVDIGALVQVTNGNAPIEIFGEATMAAGGPRIRANNLGSSGKDGVRVSFGGVDSATVDIDMVNPDPLTAFMTLDATQLGGGSGGSVTIDPCMGCPPPIIDDWWNLHPDFSAVGSGTYTLQIVHNDMVVHEASGLSGFAGASSGRPWKGGKLGGATPCWRMCYPDDTPFIIASTGAQVMMDEVRILAENAGPLEHLDYIEIRAANMEEFGLLNPQTVLPPLPTPCFGDTNGDNVVNFSDLNAVLASFGQSGAGLPGDIDGDGQVNFADLNGVLSNFGNSCP